MEGVMRSVSIARIACVAICATAFAAAARSQEVVNSASVSGRVVDPQGAPVPGALVTATQLDTNVSAETTTAQDGRFRFPYLKVGPYAIQVRLDGFNEATR